MLRRPNSTPPYRGSSAEPLSLEKCLAKTFKTQDAVLPGRNVLSHCQVVGEVAHEMINRMPDFLRSDLFPPGAELIAAAHDIGKVSPTFQKKIYTALTQSSESIASLLSAFDVDMEKQWGGHGGVSQATADGLKVGKYIPEILGQHHGYSPNLTFYQATSDVFGGQLWSEQRIELLSQLKLALDCEFPVVESFLQARVLAGLTTVADWIGSGVLFDNTDDDSPEKVERALNEAGFIKPELVPNLTFSEVFDFKPNDIQSKLIAEVVEPGVYVLEAPMGLGKTEAALYASYLLLEKKSATGIYFALPTQLTSDKIHERVNAFLSRILADSSVHKQALLVHSNAWLKPFDMGEEGNPGGAWFSQSKRGVLAPFAVGTIDQALMAVLNVKHGFVRTFGLVGKVVILDEVHSYDSFTGTIMDELISALQQLQCTVIILSATLSHERRDKLLGVTTRGNESYPLVTVKPNSSELVEIEMNAIPDVNVKIAHHDDGAAILEALRRAESGQQVLWIENTVNEAQEHYRRLAGSASEIGVACGLLHSRFTKQDRARNEEKWVTVFGKQGAVIREHQGRILVGTQVLEQSLDIDADFLVTRIAPTDMLLQRIGRLWRHEDTPRPVESQRETWLLAPNLAAAISSPQSAFGPSAKVYAPYVLCRSLAVWQSLSILNLPSQIRELIEATYRFQEESGDMAMHRHQLENQRAKLEMLALRGLSKGGTTQPEEKAQTRYSELESTEVLLIRGYKSVEENNGTWVTLLDGERVFLSRNSRSISRQKWRDISRKLTNNTLQVPEYLAPKETLRRQLSWLSDYFYLGKPEYDESVLLRAAIVGDDEFLRGLDSSQANEKYLLSYSATQGYQAIKKSVH